MWDRCYKEFIIESINLHETKVKSQQQKVFLTNVKTKARECVLEILKSSLETLLDDKIIERVFVFPGHRPWPQFAFNGPGPQFVFTGLGPQFVFAGLDRNFAFTDPSS